MSSNVAPMALQALHGWFQKFLPKDSYVTQIYPINTNHTVFEQISTDVSAHREIKLITKLRDVKLSTVVTLVADTEVLHIINKMDSQNNIHFI